MIGNRVRFIGELQFGSEYGTLVRRDHYLGREGWWVLWDDGKELFASDDELRFLEE